MSPNDSVIEWKRGILFVEKDPHPYTCFFCKERIHFVDDLPDKMNRYELELCGNYDITAPEVNIKPRALDKFCGTIFTDYNLTDCLSNVLIANEISNGIFLSNISLMNIKNVLNIYKDSSKFKEAVS